MKKNKKIRNISQSNASNQIDFIVQLTYFNIFADICGHNNPINIANNKNRAPNPNTHICFFFGEQLTHIMTK